jgi:hypothetical protein
MEWVGTTFSPSDGMVCDSVAAFGCKWSMHIPGQAKWSIVMGDS